MKPITNLENYAKNSEYLYMLLGRLKGDCDVYIMLGAMNLWGGTVEAHINEMKCIYNYLEPRPQWITESEIEFYEKEMK